jgi:hypothetical protein
MKKPVVTLPIRALPHIFSDGAVIPQFSSLTGKHIGFETCPCHPQIVLATVDRRVPALVYQHLHPSYEPDVAHA